MLPSNPIPQVCDYGSAAVYRELPNEEQIRSGVVPLDSLPAAWWNCMWFATNQAVNCARYTAGALIDEINTVLTQAGVCVCDTCVNQLYTAIEKIRQTIGNATIAGAVKSSSCPGEVSIDANGIMTANCVGNAASLTTSARTLTGAINELKSTYDCCINDLNTATGALSTNKAPVNHVSSATTYGVGNAACYGHVKLSDTYSSSVGAAADGVAASQKAVYDAYTAVLGMGYTCLGNTAGCALGTASAGSATTAARSDHVHPVPTYVACSGYAGDAGTVAGYGVAEASIASTVALRSSGGFLCATIFHDNWGAEDINSYAGSTLMFRSSDGYIRNTAPSNVSVGYATSAGSAGSAGYATSAGTAGTAGNTSTLGGYGPSVSLCAATVVVRDNEGNIWGGYYNTASADEAMSAYTCARIIFADCTGWMRKALPNTVSVGYADGAGYAGVAGSANSANAVHGGMIRSGWSVYPVNNSTICNTNDFNALAILRQGSSIYLTIVPAHDVATVSNCADGWDSWIAIWGA